jgi:starch synthase (maltosyl-transferring)
MSKAKAARIEPPLKKALSQPRIIIDRVSPSVDGGRYMAKKVVGKPIAFGATIFMDGHDKMAASLLWKDSPRAKWRRQSMKLIGNDWWETSVTPTKTGRLCFRVEAWLDRWETYRDEVQKKHDAHVPVDLEVKEGRLLLESILEFARANAGKRDESVVADDRMEHGKAVALLEESLDALAEHVAQGSVEHQVEILTSEELANAVDSVEERQFYTATEKTFEVDVERTAAHFASWYELFPRSLTDSPHSHGTFDDVIGRLPAVDAMGFDVLYFPPIHPIGMTHRKGRNNNVVASPGDPGSPYAIGSEEGGHDAVHPELGGIEGFRRLRAAAEEFGIEIALDFAIQCSPDHPWLEEHPGWFSWRPDGSIRYAENPPKKYQDIVNVDFYAEDAVPDLWLAWRDVILYWVSEGVKIFRVDNPHTKPLPFWEWLIADVRKKHPDTIFLSEAFTRPAMMYHLAKIGFSQSYTYFIWRNTKKELTDYLTELSTTEVKDFYRPNFFVNTPDINPYFLQSSGRPGFLIRAALAATLSGLWGVYSGFELCESEPLPGKEEYLDSEKYEIKPRDLGAPGNIIKEIARLNHIREENPALQTHLNVKFYQSSNDQVLYFGKFTEDKKNFILVGISLDPHNGQNAYLEVPTREFGLPASSAFHVEELMRGLSFTWVGNNQHWYFDPNELPFSIWRIRPSEV